MIISQRTFLLSDLPGSIKTCFQKILLFNLCCVCQYAMFVELCMCVCNHTEEVIHVCVTMLLAAFTSK